MLKLLINKIFPKDLKYFNLLMVGILILVYSMITPAGITKTILFCSLIALAFCIAILMGLELKTLKNKKD